MKTSRRRKRHRKAAHAELDLERIERADLNWSTWKDGRPKFSRDKKRRKFR